MRAMIHPYRAPYRAPRGSTSRASAFGCHEEAAMRVRQSSQRLASRPCLICTSSVSHTRAGARPRGVRSRLICTSSVSHTRAPKRARGSVCSRLIHTPCKERALECAWGSPVKAQLQQPACPVSVCHTLAAHAATGVGFDPGRRPLTRPSLSAWCRCLLHTGAPSFWCDRSPPEPCCRYRSWCERRQ